MCRLVFSNYHELTFDLHKLNWPTVCEPMLEMANLYGFYTNVPYLKICVYLVQ